MKPAFSIIQLITALLLSGLILLQSKGIGLGRSFGSTTYHSKRGVENLVFRLTIITSIVFVVVSAINQLFI